MKYFLAFLIPFIACQPKEKRSPISSEAQPDTLIAAFDLNKELAGSAYRTRATGYALVTEGDTSAYRPVLTESKEGRVNLLLGLLPMLTYEEQLKQLESLLPYISQEYPFDSLDGIYVGRLAQTGDLAVDITAEYLEEFGGYGSTATTEYKKIADFLARSKLGKDLNKLFNPYRLQVTGASVEKVFFTERYESVKIDSTRYVNVQILGQILDCMTWVELGKLKRN